MNYSGCIVSTFVIRACNCDINSFDTCNNLIAILAQLKFSLKAFVTVIDTFDPERYFI